MSIIHVNKVSKTFGTRSILDQVTMEICQPGIYALIGPNGSGKTTLMRIMANLLTPSQGQVTFHGMNHKNSEIFRFLSFLQDVSALYPYLTGYDHLSYAASIYQVPEDQIKETMAFTQMEAYSHQKVSTYSLGMKQNLLISLALLNQPDILLMDEPLNGLDPSKIIEVRDLIKKLAAQGRTILISSHILSELDQLTDQVYFIKDGRCHFEILDQVKSESRYQELYS